MALSHSFTALTFFPFPSTYSALWLYTLKGRVMKHKMQADCHVVILGGNWERDMNLFLISHNW